MNKQKKGSRLLLLAAATLVLAMLLGACGVDSPTGGTAQTQAGVVTVGTPTAGLNTCVSCHPKTTAEWEGTRHANLNSDPTFTTGAFCSGCHNRTGDSQFTSPVRMVVGCEACHSGGGGDNGHAAKGGAGPIGFTTFASDTIGGVTSSLYVSGQFRTCSTCHQLLLASDPAGTTPATAMHSTTAGSVRVITDTHFARNKTSFSSSSPLDGYAMDFASDTVCTDCHDPHGTVDINQEWAASAHGDKGPAQRYYSNAWARTNWSCNGTTGTGGCSGTSGISDNRRCQRCHTTTGFTAYTGKLMSGDTAGAFDLFNGVTSAITFTTAGWKPEMLKCKGCHEDNKGTLRKPGPFPANYDFFTTATATTGVITRKYYSRVSTNYPDAGNSNICVPCHTGRESGDTLKGLNDPARLSSTGFDVISGTTITFFDFSAQGLITSHDLIGAGTVFRNSGYEFTEYGRAYDNISIYMHDAIGTPAAPNTGSSGPCIGCHMSRPDKSGNHLFLPIARSYPTSTAAVDKAAATVVGITSEVCFKCHGPNDKVILDMVVEQKALFEEAVLAAAAAMEPAGMYFRGGISPQKDGTVLRDGSGANITTGSAIVTASTTTNWNALNIVPGNQFKIDSDGTLYTVVSVDSGTQITLSAPYAGPTVTSGKFTVLKSETVSVNNGSSTVTGSATLWSATSITGGDYFRVNSDGAWYRIKARTNDTTITLGPSTGPLTPYTGPTSTAESYTIISGGRITNWLSKAGPAPFAVPDTDTSGATSGRNTMGAAFNLYIMEGDPAAYAHNRYYVKRLIYDSIDWIDDYRMNFTTGTTLNTLCSGGSTPAWCTGAMEYILPNGVIPGGIAAERP